MHRIGYYEKPISMPLIHIHCVSLGEAMIGYKIGQDLKDRFNILYTTITDSGFKYFHKFENIYVVALPLDNFFFVKSFYRSFKINASIFVETEIWPELITQAKDHNIKLYLINARLSKRSYPKYKMFKFFFAPLLKKYDKILAQSADELSRFKDLGVDEQRLINTGNLKFDLTDFDLEHDIIDSYYRDFDIKEDDIILVAGSTFSGEEDALCRVFENLRNKYSNLRLIVAPRHPHRFDIVYNLFAKEGFRTVKRNGYDKTRKDWQVFVLNTIGELKYFYAISDITFVGGSLVKVGGHNVIEPAYWSKPIIIGKHYYNFTQIISDFTKSEAILIADSEEELYTIIIKLIKDKEYRQKIGINAKQVLDSNKGSLNEAKKVILDDYFTPSQQV